MFILKYIAKLVLVPVWIMLFTIWLPVHLVACICGMFHGLGKLFFGGLAIISIILGMWQNTLAFTVFIFLSFMVVLAGTIADVLLEEMRTVVGQFIIA